MFYGFAAHTRHTSLSNPICSYANQPSDVIYQNKNEGKKTYKKYLLSDMIFLFLSLFLVRFLERSERYLMWLINAANDI